MSLLAGGRHGRVAAWGAPWPDRSIHSGLTAHTHSGLTAHIHKALNAHFTADGPLLFSRHFEAKRLWGRCGRSAAFAAFGVSRRGGCEVGPLNSHRFRHSHSQSITVHFHNAADFHSHRTAFDFFVILKPGGLGALRTFRGLRGVGGAAPWERRGRIAQFTALRLLTLTAV